MTPGSDTKPTVRAMQSTAGTLIVEVHARTLVIRPFRSRKGGGGEVTVDISAVYNRALINRVRPIP